ncbi:ornithine carbamoyltransferase [Desulfohalobium retbaense]|uniref:Ornithine carbamoyltransferase n=1 Tax=Desulfohalobium retbaense (strain ATCC 49708 / DSM 5692 / JCM 16813 / HR100) TaxID=485915 RepID=C8X3L8_DESRD|nr:ornithine carbamoyltransferase [Desulfohalobium retbaense]ACV69015.1 ornithine carbamoyltransferase [Desulfohalobium retbaense DSM 5692]
MSRHFLRILDIPQQEMLPLIQRAQQLKAVRAQSHLLAGKTILLVFEKASTRTRLSFEMAVRELGGSTIFMTPMESQLGRSEPLKDSARVFSRYVHGLVVRTFGQEKLEELVEYGAIPVVNALTDSYHPCQVMSDLLTMYERTPALKDQVVAWIGDGNNMAHSWINAAAQVGFHLQMAVPAGYEPDAGLLEQARAAGARISLSQDPREAVTGADYVNTDVWASMGDEAEAEERARAFAGYLVDEELLRLANPGVKVMHCLPAHRGEEISEAVMEGPASIVWDQAENRLHMQKAILEWVFSTPERG